MDDLEFQLYKSLLFQDASAVEHLLLAGANPNGACEMIEVGQRKGQRMSFVERETQRYFCSGSDALLKLLLDAGATIPSSVFQYLSQEEPCYRPDDAAEREKTNHVLGLVLDHAAQLDGPSPLSSMCFISSRFPIWARDGLNDAADEAERSRVMASIEVAVRFHAMLRVRCGVDIDQIFNSKDDMGVRASRSIRQEIEGSPPIWKDAIESALAMEQYDWLSKNTRPSAARTSGGMRL